MKGSLQAAAWSVGDEQRAFQTNRMLQCKGMVLISAIVNVLESGKVLLLGQYAKCMDEPDGDGADSMEQTLRWLQG